MLGITAREWIRFFAAAGWMTVILLLAWALCSAAITSVALLLHCLLLFVTAACSLLRTCCLLYSIGVTAQVRGVKTQRVYLALLLRSVDVVLYNSELDKL
jgi:hypothetical protein